MSHFAAQENIAVQLPVHTASRSHGSLRLHPRTWGHLSPQLRTHDDPSSSSVMNPGKTLLDLKVGSIGIYVLFSLARIRLYFQQCRARRQLRQYTRQFLYTRKPLRWRPKLEGCARVPGCLDSRVCLLRVRFTPAVSVFHASKRLLGCKHLSR